LSALEGVHYIVIKRRVEVVRYDQTTPINAKGPWSPGAQGHQASSRLPPAGDHDLLSSCYIVQQPGQMRLGLMDPNGLSHELSLLTRSGDADIPLWDNGLVTTRYDVVVASRCEGP
jgi:hypothetical protein